MIRDITLPKYVELLRHSSEAIRLAAHRGALSGALRGLVIVQAATRTAPPASSGGSPGAVNTGHYLRAWRAVATQRGAQIANSAPYSGVIEDGRRKGARTPPRQAIARWAQRKLGLTEKEAQRAAFAIARSIAKRGLRPRKVLGSVLERIAKAALQEIAREVAKTLRGEAT